jgi:hypothetical protein
MPVEQIRDIGQIEVLRKAIAAAATNSAVVIAELVASRPPIQVLVQMKFHELGYHPIENRRLNLIEQVNQTFTYLVSLAAAAQILDRHPGSAPILLNLGTSAGSDVESTSQGVAAEIFAAVSPANNRKLAKDMAKVARTTAVHKYVFFYCPGAGCPPNLRPPPGVRVVPLTDEQVWKWS